MLDLGYLIDVQDGVDVRTSAHGSEVSLLAGARDMSRAEMCRRGRIVTEYHCFCVDCGQLGSRTEVMDVYDESGCLWAGLVMCVVWILATWAVVALAGWSFWAVMCPAVSFGLLGVCGVKVGGGSIWNRMMAKRDAERLARIRRCEREGVCKKCGSHDLRKLGWASSGPQRPRCPACGDRKMEVTGLGIATLATSIEKDQKKEPAEKDSQ